MLQKLGHSALYLKVAHAVTDYAKYSLYCCLPKSSFSISSSSVLSWGSGLAGVPVLRRRDVCSVWVGWIVSAGLLLFRRLDLTGSVCVHGGRACTTAETISGISAVVKGRIFGCFAREPPVLLACRLFLPVVVVAGESSCVGELFGGVAIFLLPAVLLFALPFFFGPFFSFGFGGMT